MPKEPTFKATVVICAHRDIKISSLACLWVLRDCPDPIIDIQFQDQDALISRSRSIRATKFLKSDSDVLMYIDDDITMSPKDASKLLWLAYQQKLDIVGAAYPTKSKDNPSMAIMPMPQYDRLKFGTEGALYEMMHVSTGCMAIRREVLQKMVDSQEIHDCVHANRRYYPFFQHREMECDGIWQDLSEDWFFCHTARKLGFKIWMDSTIKLGHIGEYEYSWDDIVNQPRTKHPNVSFGITVAKENDKIILPSAPSFAETLKKAFSFKSANKSEAVTGYKGERNGK